MTVIYLDTSEVHDLAGDLQHTGPRVIAGAQRAVGRGGFRCQGVAQTLAPVDLGTLKASISTDVQPLAFEVGPTVEYGGYVEEGTDGPYPIPNAFGWGVTVMHPGISPSPYLGPAFDRALPATIGELADVGRDSVFGAAA